jgi:hypothetical protein
MRKKASLALLGLALTIVGLVFAGQARVNAGAEQRHPAAGYVCPLTGEQLPCSVCCPLK